MNDLKAENKKLSTENAHNLKENKDFKNLTDQILSEIYETINNLTVTLSEELTSPNTLTNVPSEFETSSVSANLLLPELKAAPNS